MRQRIQDLITLLKRDRKTQVIAAAAVLMLAFLIFGDGTRRTPPPKAKRPEGSQTRVGMGGAEAYNDLVTRFNIELQSIKENTQDTAVKLDKQIRDSKDYEQRTAEIFKRILERIAETEAAVVNASMAQPSMPVTPENAHLMDGGFPEEDGLDAFFTEEPVVGPPSPPAPQKVAIIGAGDSVRVKLLAGVHAPTDGTPYPVVFKLIGDIYGPDGSALPLGEARLIAAAQGSLPDSRALFRLTSLNARMPSGQRKVLSCDGWIVGEDGVRGMEGVLIDPLGKAIVGAFITGGLDGFGRAVASSNTTVYRGPYGTEEIVTGDDFEFALGKALSGSARQWSSLIRQRAGMLVPHVEVLSGREGTAIFSKSFVIKDLYEQLEQDQHHFASLD